MQVILAKHYGMCFGVRDALRKTHSLAEEHPVTVLGELVHNEVVHENLERIGVQRGRLADLESARTPSVVITAHGASDRDRRAWKASGRQVVDTTCPLVKKAHTALAILVAQGYHPVVIGKRDHIEVRGLIGDFPGADVVLSPEDVEQLADRPRFGIVSQTTQPLETANQLVEMLRWRFPASAVRFVDTVCQPTKDRQIAVKELCLEADLIIVVGGEHSNNTRELVRKARAFGKPAHRVGRARELEPTWFRGVAKVGITAGTSTLDETVMEVVEAVRRLS